MNPSDTVFRSPLVSRYASPAMLENFSPRRRALVWRDLWIALAECQHELGLDISREQIEALRQAREEIDLGRVAELERELRHDVMAHVHAFGEKAPSARGILHLGATSCFVADGADLVLLRGGLDLLRGRLLGVLRPLADFARRHRKLPVLGFTHFQPAQPTTLGKRACLWLQDLLLDLDEIERVHAWLPFRGVKST
ncbi:MAG: lyase family protein, partial [Planctomycetota bacterium]